MISRSPLPTPGRFASGFCLSVGSLPSEEDMTAERNRKGKGAEATERLERREEREKEKNAERKNTKKKGKDTNPRREIQGL